MFFLGRGDFPQARWKSPKDREFNSKQHAKYAGQNFQRASPDLPSDAGKSQMKPSLIK